MGHRARPHGSRSNRKRRAAHPRRQCAGINIGPSPGEGTPDPRDRDDSDINAKSTAAGTKPGHGASPAQSGTSGDNAPPSELSGTAQADNQKTGGIWPFAIPIAAIFVGVPLAFMFWMRRSKTNR